MYVCTHALSAALLALSNVCAKCLLLMHHNKVAIEVCVCVNCMQRGLVQKYYRYFMKFSATFHHINLRLKKHFFFSWLDRPSGPKPPDCWGSEITFKRATFGRTLLDGWSARRRDLYVTTHNTQQETAMPPVGFETAIPASERLQTHGLDRAAAGPAVIYFSCVWHHNDFIWLRPISCISTCCHDIYCSQT